MGTHPHSLCLTEQVERPCKLVPIKHFEQYLPHSECSVNINQVTTRMNTLGGQRSLICFPSNSQSLEHTGHLLVFVELMNGMSTVWESQYISPVPNGKQRHNQTGIIWDGFNKNTTDEDVGWMGSTIITPKFEGSWEVSSYQTPQRMCGKDHRTGFVTFSQSWPLMDPQRESWGNKYPVHFPFTLIFRWESPLARPMGNQRKWEPLIWSLASRVKESSWIWRCKEMLFSPTLCELCHLIFTINL